MVDKVKSTHIAPHVASTIKELAFKENYLRESQDKGKMVCEKKKMCRCHNFHQVASTGEVL